MLKTLEQWRAGCSQEQLQAFEPQLDPLCGSNIISQSNLNKRYHGSYHRALINKNVMSAAVKTKDYIHGDSWWSNEVDAGKGFCTVLADHDGALSIERTDSQYLKSISRLLQRGVIFESDGQYHLPAELVIEYRSKENATSWITLVAGTSLPILHQLAPESAKENMLKPTPIRNELGAWLAINGALARASNVVNQLNEQDWALLLALQHRAIDSFRKLQQYCPELEPVYVVSHYYYSTREKISLRKTLEKSVPEKLRKLARLGLIGIAVQHGKDTYASIMLCDEARTLLEPHMEQMRQRMADQIQRGWMADACDVDQPSPWAMDEMIWRLWVTLHFLPVGVTQQGNPRKNEIKRIGKLLNIEDAGLTEFLLLSMLPAGLARQQGSQIFPAPVNWNTWRNKMRKSILDMVRHQNRRWKAAEEKQAFALLSELPVSCWLKLDDVINWLQLRAHDQVLHAAWDEMFTECQHRALHHLNITHKRIFLLPQFRAVVTNQPISFAAPGWRGADKNAKVHGFISASGEIQLPPDCNHGVLGKLAGFCNLAKVEQMITLQLDNKALQRMATDKASLNRSRSVLESLQSSLPQAVSYLFDKRQSQKPAATAAAASMVMVLHEASAIHKLSKTGFVFSQPFKDKPEIVLLDASADAFAFMQQCAEAGVILDTLIKPVQWVSGTASIKAWMEGNINREGHWLEICYQKTRSSKPKQLFARIDDDYHGLIYIQGTRKTKRGLSLLKSTVRLEPKHVLRLRELDTAEVNELGLDLLA